MSTDSRLLFTGINSGDDKSKKVIGAEGVRFQMSDGRWLIDGSNTGGALGHKHPAIVEAIRKAAEAPVVNEGWLWVDREEAARELVETAFGDDLDWVGAVRFFLSGSEANDLALSLAQSITGRQTLATRERAYHGMTGLSRDMTVQPQWHGGLSSLTGGFRPVPPSAHVVQVPGPGRYRFGETSSAPITELLSGAPEALSEAAAVIVDYTQGGVYYDSEYQDELARHAKASGALWIADEVVTGLGRNGGWFAYQNGTTKPDIVTLGKHVGGGGAPAGAVVVSRELLERMDGWTWQTYSTFRGHPLTIAAVRATIATMASTDLINRAYAMDDLISARMADIAAKHPSVLRIGGRGMHWTVEVQGPDWREWRGDSAVPPLATRIAARAAEAGALIGTSGEQTSVFISPALVMPERDLHSLLDALDHGLALADEELDRNSGR